MGTNKFYTPDGFTDTLPQICVFKRGLEGNLRSLFSMHGYSEIETPGVEYCDIYTDMDFVKEESLYKYCDYKGRMLCSRYDGTVPAARFAATVYKDETLPLRLSYIENMYRFNDSGGGKQSEFTQAGVELMGASGSSADAEVIVLAIKSALSLGITDLQVSIGQVEFFRGLCRQLKLTDESSEEIKKAIKRKDSVTVEKTAKAAGVSEDDTKLLLMLSEGYGTYDTLDAFEKAVTDEGAKAALSNIREILQILDCYGFTKYVTVDLGLLGSVDYYTGVIFKGYTYEVGFPIISGGRYDNVARVFGRDIASVGFSLSLTLSITAMMRRGTGLPGVTPDVLVGYDKDAEGAMQKAISVSENLRAEGSVVVLDTMGRDEEQLDSYAAECGIETVVFIGKEEV